MISFLRSSFLAWRGVGEYSVTVPPMDGALRPNQAIEEAPALLDVLEPDNLCRYGGALLFSTRDSVQALKVSNGSAVAEDWGRFDHPVTALATHPGGAVAVGLDDGRIILRGGAHDGTTLRSAGNREIVCPTALAFADGDTLVLALGSQQNPATRWKHDLMQRRASGSVWRIDLTTKSAICLGDKLAYPYGLLVEANGDVVVSESWRNRLVRLSGAARTPPAPQFEDITGFPARMSAASGGGVWLAVFAPRSQLVEFVLRERAFREQMIGEIEPDFWIAPSLSAPQSFLEPLQGGALKHLGILKAWAPTRSYGLVIRMDAGYEPRASLHSRADARRHGITSCVEFEGRLIATSKGGDTIVSSALQATN